MLNQIECLDLIVRYLNDPQDASLHAKIASLRENSPEGERFFKEVERVWLCSSKADRLNLISLNQAEKNIKYLLKNNTSQSNLKRWVGGIAASIFIVGFGILFFNNRNKIEILTVKTGNDQVDTVTLVDGSKVILAANTEFKYPNKFNEKTRNVSLYSGKAFFLVAKDPKHPFRVNMGISRISVLGTSFNLTFSKEIIGLDVKTGRVMFSPYKEAVSSILSAGQGLSYNITKKQFLTRVAQNSDSWVTKELLFVDTPLEEVCRQLSNCYGVEITFDEGKRVNKKFNASFKNERLNDILKVLKQTYDLEIKQEGNKLTLKTL